MSSWAHAPDAPRPSIRAVQSRSSKVVCLRAAEVRPRTRTVNQGSATRPACACPTPSQPQQDQRRAFNQPQIRNRPAPLLVSAYVEPPAGIEPATPSLPWNYREPLCGSSFPQVVRDRGCQGRALSTRRGAFSLSGAGSLSPRRSCPTDHQLAPPAKRAWRPASARPEPGGDPPSRPAPLPPDRARRRHDEATTGTRPETRAAALVSRLTLSEGGCPVVSS
jgi:hypothetical protein